KNFKDLVDDMTLNRQDIHSFAWKSKAMIAKMEYLVKQAKWEETYNWYLSTRSTSRSLHCLALNLAEEYATNVEARSLLPLPQHFHRLTDRSLQHVVVLTDNVLAACAVVSSTARASRDPGRLVFHVITDKKTYAPMNAWFATNAAETGAVVEVKGLHQYDWSGEVNVSIEKMMEVHRRIWRFKYASLKTLMAFNDHELSVLNPSSTSLLNHLRMYLPELFPDLEKVVLLDDDVVVQRDLSSLWDLEMDRKVLGAVVHSECPGRRYADYFDFTDGIISSMADPERCGWLFGVNVFDLERWRRTNITSSYHQWLQLYLKASSPLWNGAGVLPPALLAFHDQVHPIDPSWQLSGLGERYPPRLDDRDAEAAAGVLHFSGPGKPWLEIAPEELRNLWSRYVDSSNEHIRRCGI
ncbi:glycosyltransferase, partial [Genlisea aurea]